MIMVVVVADDDDDIDTRVVMVMSFFVGVESGDSLLFERSLIGISGIVVSLCDTSRIDCSLSETSSLTKVPYVSVTTNTSGISDCE